MLSNWLKVSFLLCVYGFFRELRPSEPFSTEFFIGHRNLTTDDITQILYPLGTYSYMIQLIVVFLVTDMLRWVCNLTMRWFYFFTSLACSCAKPFLNGQHNSFVYRLILFRWMQLQTSHHFFRALWLHGVCVDAMDEWIRRACACADILRDVYGHRGGVLHVHLCQSRTQQISNGDRAHAIGNFGRTIFGRRFCASADHLPVDELPGIELSIVWM